MSRLTKPITLLSIFKPFTSPMQNQNWFSECIRVEIRSEIRSTSPSSLGLWYAVFDLSVFSVVLYLPTSWTRLRQSVELTNFQVLLYLASARALDTSIPLIVIF